MPFKSAYSVEVSIGFEHVPYTVKHVAIRAFDTSPYGVERYGSGEASGVRFGIDLTSELIEKAASNPAGPHQSEIEVDVYTRDPANHFRARMSIDGDGGPYRPGTVPGILRMDVTPESIELWRDLAFHDVHGEGTPFRVSDQRVMDWMVWCGSGESAKAIMLYMHYGIRNSSYPCDSGDFGRCERLLKAFPEWRKRMSEMVVCGSKWERIAPLWERLRLYYNENPGYSPIDTVLGALENGMPTPAEVLRGTFVSITPIEES